MSSGTQTPNRSRRPFFGRTVAEDVDRELELHLELRAQELIDEGWEGSEARAEARRRFGDLGNIRDQCRQLEQRRRDARRRHDMLDAFLQDVRFSVRKLRNEPAFSLAALLTLTLGIGAVSAVYSLVHGVLIAPLPYAEPESIVLLHELSERGNEMRVSYPNYHDWKEQTRSYRAMALMPGWTGSSTVLGGDRPVNVATASVSREFFGILGVAPLQGRHFRADEAQFGADPAALVSEGYWRRHLGADSELDGHSVRFSGVSYRVVGVMPAGFDVPAGTDIWVPLELDDYTTSGRTAHNFHVIARLADGVTVEQATSELSAIADRLYDQYGDNDAVDASVVPLHEELVGDFRRPLWLLLAAAMVVLLAAATNLASSLLARAVDRRRELALRGALGAGRERVVRQLLTETLVLTTLGGILGSALSFLGLNALRAIDPGRIPRLANVQIDVNVLAVTLVVSTVTGLVFGLIPALFATRRTLRSALAPGRGGSGEGSFVWSGLVATEVALAMVLLIGAGLLLRELWQLLSVDPGFETARVLTLDVSVPDIETPSTYAPDLYRNAEAEVASYYGRLIADLEELPGVVGVGLVNNLPLSGSDLNGTFCFDNEDCLTDDGIVGESGYASYRVVSEGYFGTLGIPLLLGRLPDHRDGPESQHVVVVNESLANHYWPDGDAIGQRIRPVGLDLHGDEPATVIGVVGDILHRGLDRSPARELYLPYRQRAYRARYATLTVATRLDSELVVPELTSMLRTSYPDIPIDLIAMSERRLGSVAEERFASALLAAFAALALILAATGIWGVVSYQVAQRTQEIGVRIALGAQPRGVLRLVLIDVLKVVGAGAGLGLVASAGLSRLVQSRLFAIEATDPMIPSITIAVLMATAVAASLVPALRAARIDPVRAINERAA